MSRPWLILVCVLLVVINGIDGVINGQRACQGQFPYVAAIWKLDKSICAGGIINENHILTAAHCTGVMTELECTVTVGTVDLRRPPIRIRALNFYPHPNYTRLTNFDAPKRRMVFHDLAIIKLATELQWSSTVQPISLRRQPGFASCGCHIAGWGSTEQGSYVATADMRWAKMYVLPINFCRRFVRISINEGCLYDPGFITSAGPGDSGGPVNCNGLLVGILTAGLARRHAPSSFLRIYPYLEFIDEVLSYTPPRPTPTPNVFEFLNQQGLLCPQDF